MIQKQIFRTQNYQLIFRNKFNISQNVRQELSLFSEFKKAEEYEQNQKYVQAVNEYSRVAEILENVRQESSPSYEQVLKQIFNISLENNIPDQRINSLDKIFHFQKENYRKLDKQVFINFANQCLQINGGHSQLIKLFELAEMQPENKQIQELYNFYQPINTLIFDHDYQYAQSQVKNLVKKKESELQLDYQNQAIVNWVSTFEGFNKLEIHKDAYKNNNKQITQDQYDEIIKSFYLSLSFSENQQVNSSNFKDITFNNPDSLQTLFSLAEFSLDCGLDFDNEQQMYMNKSLKSFEQLKPDQVYIPLISLAYKSMTKGEFIRSEGLFGTIQSMIQADQTASKSILKPISDFYFGQMLTIIDTREAQGNKMIDQALEDFSLFGYIGLPKSEPLDF